MSEHKKEHIIENKASKLKLLSNYWAVASIVLAVILVIVLAVNFTSGISKAVAEEKIKSFLASQGLPEEAYTITKVEETSQLYIVSISLSTGQSGALSITKDGKYIGSMQLIPDFEESEDTNQQAEEEISEVPKSDKPKVELFIMSYCPYGTQAEKGLIPVLQLLKDKIDGNIRYVHYTMHGEKEDIENYRQLCIKEIYGKEKSYSYLMCILNSSDVYNPANVTDCIGNMVMNAASITSCIDKEAKTYYERDSKLSEQYGVQGSPTLVINGVQANSARDSASFLKTICSAFNEQPEECSETLSSSSPSPGFGHDTSTDAPSVASCGQ